MSNESATSTNPDSMTLAEAAMFLHVQPRELEAAVRAGEVPYTEYHDELRFSRSKPLALLRGSGRPSDGIAADR